MFAHQGYHGTVTTPNDIFHWWAVNLCNRLLLLNIIENNRGRRAEEKAGCAAIEDFVRLYRRLNGLDDSI